MKEIQGCDIIADVHGRHPQLRKLLGELGYRREGSAFIPPLGRKALFLGDLIDTKRGHAVPGGVRDTLQTVKAMQEGGHALAIMGNHEFNALCFHTAGPNGRPLRSHSSGNIAMHQGTLDDFPDHAEASGEWHRVWLPWMMEMPLALDLGGIRAVHACWHPAHLERLAGRSLKNRGFLIACSSEASPEGQALKTVLKGVEIPLPRGISFTDHGGNSRRKFRARWWEAPAPDRSCRDLVFPDDERIPQLYPPMGAGERCCPYPADAPPLFIGHYSKPGGLPLAPERPNLACLDYGAGSGGPLVAYRWSGERVINPAHFVGVS